MRTGVALLMRRPWQHGPGPESMRQRSSALAGASRPPAAAPAPDPNTTANQMDASVFHLTTGARAYADAARIYVAAIAAHGDHARISFAAQNPKMTTEMWQHLESVGNGSMEMNLGRFLKEMARLN